MVRVFREVRRVTRPDGVLWLNLGDSYSGSGKGPTGENGLQNAERRMGFDKSDSNRGSKKTNLRGGTIPTGLKAKDLMGIPWAVAKALQQPYYTGKIKQEKDRAWLAAMIDGEGSIGAVHHIRDNGDPRTFVNINITNTSLSLLDEADRIWKANRHDHITNGEGHLGKKPCYRWIVNGVDNQIALIKEIYPHLIIKRKQAVLAYNLLLKIKVAKHLGHTPQKESARGEREALARMIQALNQGEDIEIPKDCDKIPSLYEEGWYLRSAIPWIKRNCMPESTTDRPTSAIEYVFLMAKSAKYFYDGEAIRVPSSESYQNDARPQGVLRQKVNKRSKYPDAGQFKKQDHTGNRTYKGFNERYTQKNLNRVEGIHTMHRRREEEGIEAGDGQTRNYRNSDPFFESWQGLYSESENPLAFIINPQARPELHFATFPDLLAETCIKAGTSEYGCCPKCGAPYQRIVEASGGVIGKSWHPHTDDGVTGQIGGMPTEGYSRQFKSWQPTCKCGEKERMPCLVLDPFMGSGTVAVVARELNRSSVGCELNPEYVGIIRKRLQTDSQLDTGIVKYVFKKV